MPFTKKQLILTDVSDLEIKAISERLDSQDEVLEHLTSTQGEQGESLANLSVEVTEIKGMIQAQNKQKEEAEVIARYEQKKSEARAKFFHSLKSNGYQGITLVAIIGAGVDGILHLVSWLTSLLH